MTPGSKVEPPSPRTLTAIQADVREPPPPPVAGAQKTMLRQTLEAVGSPNLLHQELARM